MKLIKLSIMLLVCSHAVAQTQDLNFADNGILMANQSPYSRFDRGAIQNNRLIVDGTESIIGHTLNGTLDFDFADNGAIDDFEITFQWQFSGSLNYGASSARSVVNNQYSLLASNGAIYNQQFEPTDKKLAFQFFNSDGNENTSLPNNGFLMVDFSKDWDIQSAEFSPNNDNAFVILADEDVPPGSPDSLCIASVTKDGIVNNAWGVNGISFLNLSTLINGFNGYDFIKLCPTNDAVYVVAVIFSQIGNTFSVLKFNANGSYDNGFGVKSLSQILALQYGNDQLNDFVIDGNYAYVLANDRKIHRLTLSDFTIDSSFGNSGVATAVPSNGLYSKLQIINNKIYGIGSTLSSGTYKPLLSRHSINGSVDQSFGTNGSLMENWPQFLDDSAFLGLIPTNGNTLYIAGKSYFVSQSGNDDYEDDFIVKYTLTDPTAINEPLAPDFKLYPNPAFEVLNIEAKGDYTVKIYTMQGQLIQTHIANNPTRLDVSGLAQGVYMAAIENGTGVSRMSFIKQ